MWSFLLEKTLWLRCTAALVISLRNLIATNFQRLAFNSKIHNRETYRVHRRIQSYKVMRLGYLKKRAWSLICVQRKTARTCRLIQRWLLTTNQLTDLLMSKHTDTYRGRVKQVKHAENKTKNQRSSVCSQEANKRSLYSHSATTYIISLVLYDETK